MRRKRRARLKPSELDPLVRVKWDQRVRVRAMARELGVTLYQVEASLFRQGLNIPATPECPKETEEAVVSARTNSRISVSNLCKLFGLSYFMVRRILRRYNVFAGDRERVTPSGSDHPCSKLSYEQWKQLEEDLRMGVRHAIAARKYGISRERVRQLAQRFGTPPGRDLQRKERAVKNLTVVKLKTEKSVQRAQALENKYVEWRKLWAEGSYIREIAATMGLDPKLAAVRIVQLRRKLGWFPRRNKVRQPPTPDAATSELASSIVSLWDSGKTATQIAALTGNPKIKIRYMISAIRKATPGRLYKRTPIRPTPVDVPAVRILSSDPEVVAEYQALLGTQNRES